MTFYELLMNDNFWTILLVVLGVVVTITITLVKKTPFGEKIIDFIEWLSLTNKRIKNYLGEETYNELLQALKALAEDIGDEYTKDYNDKKGTNYSNPEDLVSGEIADKTNGILDEKRQEQVKDKIKEVAKKTSNK